MMLCPLCAIPLEAVERLGIELDHCPDCNGMWLDAGELTNLVEREAVAALRQGERVLTKNRHGKEYDRPVHETDDSGGRYGVIPGLGSSNVAFSKRAIATVLDPDEYEIALR